MDKVSVIQQLREATGAGVMECKKVLEEAGGDLTLALSLIKERGLAKVEKRADRQTGAGMVYSYIHNGRIGVLLHLCAETDFVVRSDPFQLLAHELALQLAAVPSENIDEFLGQPYVRDESRTVKSLIDDVIARVGENVRIQNFSRMQV